MIGQLRGILLEKHPPQLLLDVQGVAYEIDAPMSTFYHLPETGQEVVLYTHFAVREDAHNLYGFYTREERFLFRSLLKVNGVGPKLALTILSDIEPDEFVRCIVNNDAAGLTCLPGVGKKTAERLVIELRDKLGDWKGQALILPQSHSAAKGRSSRHQMIQDATAALVALGYKPPEASRAVLKVDDGNLTSEEMIRCALREMAG
jgi:Holliday junction DNA helicase RuvA